MTRKTGESLLEFLRANSQPPLPEEEVVVSQWGRKVCLRGVTVKERDVIEAAQFRRREAAKRKGLPESDAVNFRARWVAHSIWEDGRRPLANDEGERLLSQQPAAALEPMFAAVMRLNGMNQEDVDEIEKNSDETEDAASSSVSPSPTDAPLPN